MSDAKPRGAHNFGVVDGKRNEVVKQKRGRNEERSEVEGHIEEERRRAQSPTAPSLRLLLHEKISILQCPDNHYTSLFRSVSLHLSHKHNIT